MGFRKIPRPIFILFLLFSFLCFPTGCNKYARYRALKFFFDGVPHPDEPLKQEEVAPVKTANAEKPKKVEPPPPPPQYTHPPAEGKDDCSFCHGPVTRMVIPPKDMCLKCHLHINIREMLPLAFIHGPAALDCLACHNPHESQAKSLLKKIGNPLCFDCHDQGLVKKAEAHKNWKEAGGDCLSCHDPHAAKDRFFLK